MAYLIIKLPVLLLLTSLLPFIASSTHHQFLQCFKAQLGTSQYNPNDITYAPANASFLSLLHAYNLRPSSVFPKTPLLIITPFHQIQIQAAIVCSRRISLHVRIRSGGHDYEGLSHTSTVPFIILDLRNLDSIEVDVESRTAWVEAGATLGQLYYAIGKKSRTLGFPAGTCPSVGVGGHLSGGGFGMMSRKHSIASDRIIDAALIDADGRILNRRSMGEDLFWAIRGGGGTSFGVITAFKVELVVVPETVTVFNVTKTLEQNATQLVQRWQYIADQVDERLVIRVLLGSITAQTSWGGTNKTIAATFIAQFLGSVRDLLPIMQANFPELGVLEQDCTEMSWIESVLVMGRFRNQPVEILQNKTPFEDMYFKGKSDFVRDPIPVEGLVGIWRFLRKNINGEIKLQFTPYGGVMNKYSESETPFPHRSGNIFMIHYGLVLYESDPVEMGRQLNRMREVYEYMSRYVTKSPRAAYFNYRDLDLGCNNEEGYTSYEAASVWGLKYFKGNFGRLVRVKTKFDPTNFFRNQQSIPPIHKLIHPAI